VAIDHLMEDAATVEIARSQVWQWLHYGTPLSDGRRVTRGLVDPVGAEELARWWHERPSTTHLDQAREGFHRSGTRRGLPELHHHRCLRALPGDRHEVICYSSMLLRRVDLRWIAAV
jgi:Malate synthase, C-terminal